MFNIFTHLVTQNKQSEDATFPSGMYCWAFVPFLTFYILNNKSGNQEIIKWLINKEKSFMGLWDCQKLSTPSAYKVLNFLTQKPKITLDSVDATHNIHPVAYITVSIIRQASLKKKKVIWPVMKSLHERVHVLIKAGIHLGSLSDWQRENKL